MSPLRAGAMSMAGSERSSMASSERSKKSKTTRKLVSGHAGKKTDQLSVIDIAIGLQTLKTIARIE